LALLLAYKITAESGMSKDPKDKEDRPRARAFDETLPFAPFAHDTIGTSDDLRSIDRAMLLALSHRQRDSTPLSLDQEMVLSIPDKPSEEDDGLLTASEVAMLKLNADFVVLSACSTAAGDKPGAEALSGLARAYFYPGAKSLVVSHWEVDSEATVALMDGLF
jgi:hypothetical protein